MDFLNEVGSRIKYIRDVHGLRQHQFAAQLDCKSDYISKIENGRVDPSFDTLKKISSVFHRSVDYILTGQDYTVNGTAQYESPVGLNTGHESDTAKEALRLLESGIISISRSATVIRRLDAEKQERVKELLDKIFNLEEQLKEEPQPY